MLRLSVLILASWPLLMPPGMCLCQLTGSSALSTQEGKIAAHNCCDGCGGLADSRHETPNHKPCPPHCPAKADNYKLFEKTKPLLTMATLDTPAYALVHLPAGRRPEARSGPSYPSGPAIYLAVCSLVI